MAFVLDNGARWTQLIGTSEADTFRFISDGHTDAISGFEDDRDIIDLSLFDGLTFADLSIRDGRDGRVVIEFTDPTTQTAEKIFLKDNAPGFQASDLTEADFQFAPANQTPPPVPPLTVMDRQSPWSQLIGTADAEVFVFLKDGFNDGLVGYDPDQDFIDLSAYAGLTFDDLTIRNGNFGRITITYENGDTDTGGNAVVEKITLKDNVPGFFAADLTEDNFIFG